MIRQSNIRADKILGFEKRVCLADPEILDIFNLPIAAGDSKHALTTPRGMIVTESAAQIFFGSSNPVGKVVRDEGKFPGEYVVTGVLKDLPQTSILQFDFLTASLPDWPENHWMRKSWNGTGVQTFVVLEPFVIRSEVAMRLTASASLSPEDQSEDAVRYHFQPLVDAHLYSRQDYGIAGGRFFNTNGDIQRIYVAGLLGGLILLLAVLNFVNLSTARSATRAKEVGTRRTIGAYRHQIVGQFLWEAVVLSAFAHLLALEIVALSLPSMSEWIGMTLTLSGAGTALFLALPASTAAVGVLAGLWPALVMSGLGSTAKRMRVASGSSGLRNGLVLLQFGIAVLLISAAWVIYGQWRFMVEEDPGYDRTNVVIMPYPGGDPETVRQRFFDYPGIRHACVTNDTPVGAGGVFIVRPEGETEDWRMKMFDLNEDVLDVFGIELLMGRDFSNTIPTDRTQAYMLNESAVKALGWQNPVGRTFQIPGWGRWAHGHVIGVVKDFHFESMHEEIRPLFLKHIASAAYVSVRVDARRLLDTMSFIEKTWRELAPDRPFKYQFLDQELAAVYQAEAKASQMFLAGAFLAILIASLGLVGLTSFSTAHRTKEIGIRKVLGATSASITAILTRDLLKWVVFANLLAIPLSVHLTLKWLEGFAYRIEPGPWPYLASGVVSLLVASATVFLTAFRPATSHPVTALRSE